ncbi:MAG: hypothetical protein ABS35_23450, partial [Kaistia sp. SCN 65-12]
MPAARQQRITYPPPMEQSAPLPVETPILAGNRLTIDLAALARNWQALAAIAAGAETAAAVKGNGYGIGLEPAVRALAAAGCRTFFVALPDEGVRTRTTAPDATIYVLNGLARDLATVHARHNLRPVIGSPGELADWAAYRAQGGRGQAALHVDTGMGFERVTAIKQGTKEFSNFGGIISNYETDVFRPIFNRLEQLSGKKYGSTLPKSGSTGDTEQEKIDVAFRVIADHIRTLTFSIADGILPGNNDRNYVLRRILLRAVKYGRTLGFHQPFFYQLVDVLVENMSHVFPEIKQRQDLVPTTNKSEEESFNKTLDSGIELFRDEVAKSGMGRTGASPVPSGAPPDEKKLPATGRAQYSKRHLPHFERPWGKYMVTFTTKHREKLTPDERDLVLKSLKYGHEHNQYLLYAAVVMPDHAHILFEPQIQKNDESGKPVFWSLAEILHGIKSTTSHRINKVRNKSGTVWEEENFDRLIRSEADLHEKFGYITGNPWSAGVVQAGEEYPWLIPDQRISADKEASKETGTGEEITSQPGGGGAAGDRRGACPPQISGEFAFKLYDTYGFPLDLTQLMAREAGLSVDEGGFNALMEEQRARARASQKKEVISVTHIEGATPTLFQGYDSTEISAKVLDVIQIKEKLAVILDVSPFYAEMGGQVGDTGTISGGGNVWHVVNTTKVGNTWVHYISESDAPSIGMEVELSVDPARRNAIQRHHTVTHLFHWALHEVVSKDAVQKGSFVGPEKLTFDFNSGALTPAQIRDIEKLVNERILENAGVSWTEIPYSEVKSNPGIMHLFGEKYGDRVRVVQIGGENGKLNGYSMELCGGTHTRATGEIGYFRITGESAVAAGIRRVEAVAGGEAYNRAIHDFETIHSIAGKLNAPIGEVEKKIDALLAHQKELEKQLKTLQQKQAAEQARALLQKSATLGKTQAIVQNLGEADGDYLQSTIDALKGEFKGVIVLTGATNGSVSLAAAVSPDLIKQIQAGKIIQAIAPIVGGKGGGRPEFARGAGKDASKIQDALRESEKLIA